MGRSNKRNVIQLHIENNDETDVPIRKRLRKRKDADDDEEPFVQIDDEPESEEETVDDVNCYDDLMAYEWFYTMDRKSRVKYCKKYSKLIEGNKKALPTIKDVLDMKIDKIVKKRLLKQLQNIEYLDPMDTEYEYEVDSVVRTVEAYNDPELNNSALRKLEKRLVKNSSKMDKLRERILTSNLDESVKTIIFNRYQTAMKMSCDEQVKYTMWIDIALSIPHHPKEIMVGDQGIPHLISKMSKKLDEKIYALEDAKEEVMCTIATMINNPNSKNKAMGLIGPPGVGKTMLVKVIAEELGLPFEQISLGGTSDIAFLKGHSFTYVGSEPGCIVKCLTKMGCTNGIIYLDEIDKISKTSYGDEIQSALLHIVDSTQNHNFRDRYIPEIPVDLSNVIFIYSMNSLKDMDSALISRIPLIHVAGYNPVQKISILHDYLIPEILMNYPALSASDLLIPKEVAQYFIEKVREEGGSQDGSGVRNLKSMLDKIIKRINYYRMMIETDIPLPKYMKGFQIPYTLTQEMIDHVISEKTTRDNTSYAMIYM